jgi:hypothetical protein
MVSEPREVKAATNRSRTGMIYCSMRAGIGRLILAELIGPIGPWSRRFHRFHRWGGITNKSHRPPWISSSFDFRRNRSSGRELAGYQSMDLSHVHLAFGVALTPADFALVPFPLALTT